MSKAFTKDDGTVEPLARPKVRLAPGEKRYITEEGFARLQQELAAAQAERERRLAHSLEGDASLWAADHLHDVAALAQRIEGLSSLIALLTVVPPAASREAVVFGATVEVEDEDGQRSRYRIVGPDEVDLAKGWISVDSPIARALLGKRVDDAAVVQRPKGALELTVRAIE
jgi:transcription elongation factor GreB